MKLEKQLIRKIYTGNRARNYDLALPHMFSIWKKKAIKESSLKPGDTVLVFCCGTGLDFPHILEKIGSEGRIIGIDFSSKMLHQAKEKAAKNMWQNIELIEADVTCIGKRFENIADAGVCTLGLSIIPEYKTTYKNLLSCIKNKGQVIIGDMQLASGWRSKFNPLTIFLSKGFGGTFEGHNNSKAVFRMMKKDLINVRKKEFFLKSYYYCIGNKS